MVILALDASGTTASVALVSEHIVIAESSVTLADLKGTGRKTHSETLMPMIDQLFEISGMCLKDIDYIACTCGPGSFTGLRIGAATAKGLSFASGKPLIAVPTLDAMAYTVKDIAPPSAWVVPMMDARRGQVYSAIYRECSLLTEYLAEPVEVILSLLKEQMVREGQNISPIIFIGDGAICHKELIQGKMAECETAGYTLSFLHRPRGASVGLKALEMAKAGQFADESEFSLLYIRKPQAQRELEERQK